MLGILGVIYKENVPPLTAIHAGKTLALSVCVSLQQVFPSELNYSSLTSCAVRKGQNHYLVRGFHSALLAVLEKSRRRSTLCEECR